VATLSTEDLDIYYELLGAGPRLLIFNGSAATIESSRALIDHLAASFEVLVHDQRGLGRTGLPTAGGQFTMAAYAADALALLEHVGWPSARIFGISFGGMVAQEFAVTWPDRVERLALLCTSPGGKGGSSYPLHELDGMEPQEQARISLRNLDTRFSPAWLEDHAGDRALVELMSARADTPRQPREREGERLQLKARRGHDVWDRLERISCPTLVACGRFDGVAPPANSEAIASRITGSRLCRYDGGHLFLFQDPRASPEIAAFLSG
jgi:pimeloyl-ACP methyl ester carboxylesterase